MTDAEMQREIERAQRNTRKLRALEAENERVSAKVAGLADKTPTTPIARLASRPHTGLRA